MQWFDNLVENLKDARMTENAKKAKQDRETKYDSEFVEMDEEDEIEQLYSH